MSKTWHLHKSGHKFDITINGVNVNEIDADIKIDGDKTVKIDEIQGNLIKFKRYVRIADTSYLGVRFNDFEGQEEKFVELTSYYNSLKENRKSSMTQNTMLSFQEKNLWITITKKESTVLVMSYME